MLLCNIVIILRGVSNYFKWAHKIISYHVECLFLHIFNQKILKKKIYIYNQPYSITRDLYNF